jgi:hybrid cluster-associated redox disulfide protein
MVELISGEMVVEQVANRHPETIKIFVRYSLHCIGCAIGPFHTIDQVAAENQLDLEQFLADLNGALAEPV